MSKIVEEAKKIQVNQPKEKVTSDEIELAFGWLTGELKLKQMNIMFKKPAASVLLRMPYIFQEAYRQGKLTIKK